MKRRSTAVLAIIMLTGLTQAASIEVQPSTFTLSPTPGDTINQSVDVTWNGDTSTVISADTEITPPEGETAEGISITHHPENQGFYPGESKEFTIQIETSTALKPAEYSFETNFETSVKDTSSSGGSSGGSIDTSSYELVQGDKIENLSETVENQSDEIDRLAEENQNLSESLNQTREKNSDLREEIQSSDAPEDNTSSSGTSTPSQTTEEKTGLNPVGILLHLLLSLLIVREGLYLIYRF